MDSKLTKALLYIILISPIFLQYKAWILSYGMILLLICVIALILYSKEIVVDRDFLVLVTAMIIQTTIACLIYGYGVEYFVKTTGFICCVIFISYLSIFCSDNVIDEEWFYTLVKRTGIVVVGIVYFQIVLYSILDIRPGPIMLLPQPLDVMNNWQSSSRPCSFFSEPAVFSIYSLIYLIISMNKKDFVYAIFVSVGILLSGSSLGIIITLIIWIYYLISSYEKKIYKISIVLAIALLIGMFGFLPQMDTVRRKVISVFVDFNSYRSGTVINSFSYSNFLRTFKGWNTFFELPSRTKIVGVGLFNFKNYMLSHNISFSWNSLWRSSDSMASYFSSASGVAIECGMIIGLIYCVFLYRKTMLSTDVPRIIIILLIVESFVGNIFFNSMFIFYFLMYYVYCKPQRRIVFRLNRRT